MKKGLRRGLSLLIVVLMFISLVPVSVMAEESSDGSEVAIQPANPIGNVITSKNSTQFETTRLKESARFLGIGTSTSVGVSYRTHVQNVGWETKWASDSGTAGTQGQGLRLEGIQIRLMDMPDYSIEYRTHVQNVGWETTWAADGGTAGTQGQGLRLEGIQIRVVKKVTEPTTDLTNRVDITPDGGNIALTDGASVSVPNGALTEPKTVTLDRLVESSGSESEASAVYHFTGLPETWQAPLEILLPMEKSQPDGTSTYIVINGGESYRPSSGETGTNRTLLKAEVTGGMAKVNLASSEGFVVSSLQNDTQPSTMEEGTAIDLTMYVETGLKSSTINGTFEVIVSDQIRKKYPTIINELEGSLVEASYFINSPTGMNMSYTGGRTPIPVEIFGFDGFFSSRSKNAWGYLEVSGWTRKSQISNGWISINALKLGDPDASNQFKATVSHELFHYYEQLYLPNDGKSQDLLQDASCVWLEFEMMKNISNYWPKVLEPEDAAWFTKKGLLRDYDSVCNSQRNHTYAASLFLRYMTEQKGTTAMGDLWGSVRDHNDVLTALADGFHDPNWYLEWPKFVQKLYAGDYTKAIFSDPWEMHNNAVNPSLIWSVDDPYTQNKYQLKKELYPLAAQGFQISLRYNTKAISSGDKGILKITNENSDNVILYLYRKMDSGDFEYLAEINSDTPYVLSDLEVDGQQKLSIIATSKWQPTTANMNETKEASFSAVIEIEGDTAAYNALVASSPKINMNNIYTKDSWALYETAIAGCNLKLTAASGQKALDAEVIKIQAALDLLVKENSSCYCGHQHDFSKLKKIDNGYRDVYYLNEAGQKHGPWLIWHDTERTKLFSSTCYFEDQINGRAITWYEDGTMRSQIDYKLNLMNGSNTTWYENGNMESQGEYTDNKAQGLHRTIYESGAKMKELNFEDGVQNGLGLMWYENGNLSLQANYLKGKPEGLCTIFHANGLKSRQSIYVNGERNGLDTQWYESGNKMNECTYKNDVPIGIQYNWSENGKLTSSYNHDTGETIYY